MNTVLYANIHCATAPRLPIPRLTPHLKQGERLVHGSFSPGRRCRVVTFQLIAGLVTHIGVTSPDQFDGKVVQLVEVVGAVGDLVGCVP